MNAKFIKYFYVFILFIITFIATNSSITEATAYGFMSGMQGLFLVLFTFELINDSARGYKALKIHAPKTYYSDESTIQLPLYWIIFPTMIMQFISSILTAIYTSFLQKKYGNVKLSRENRIYKHLYKWGFIVATIALVGLLYSYTSDFTDANLMIFSSGYKSWLLILIFMAVTLSILNFKHANHISRIINSTTE